MIGNLRLNTMNEYASDVIQRCCWRQFRIIAITYGLRRLRDANLIPVHYCSGSSAIDLDWDLFQGYTDESVLRTIVRERFSLCDVFSSCRSRWLSGRPVEIRAEAAKRGGRQFLITVGIISEWASGCSAVQRRINSVILFGITRHSSGDSIYCDR